MFVNDALKARTEKKRRRNQQGDFFVMNFLIMKRKQAAAKGKRCKQTEKTENSSDKVIEKYKSLMPLSGPIGCSLKI